MKKITFILFALITGTTFGQNSADATASADIVSPITIVKFADFNFGQVSNGGGTVIIATDNSVDVASTATSVGTNTYSAAAFTVNATDTYTYGVTLPADVTLSNLTTAGSSMTVSALGHNSSLKGTGSDETFGVGGTLTVANGQIPGHYEGTMTVSVSYN